MQLLYFEVMGPCCSPALRAQMLTSACSALSISALLLQGLRTSLQMPVSACAVSTVPNSATAAMIVRFMVRPPDHLFADFGRRRSAAGSNPIDYDLEMIRW
jgi:hypothetical protein